MFAGAAALLQLRLLEAYAALPSPAAYADEQEALTKLCMRAVRWGAAGGLVWQLLGSVSKWHLQRKCPGYLSTAASLAAIQACIGLTSMHCSPPLPRRRSAASGAAGQMLHSALRRWLHAEDALLGPWQMGRDPLERALYSFEGVSGGPAIQPWQAGSRAGIGYAMEEEGDEEQGSSGGQDPGGLGGRLQVGSEACKLGVSGRRAGG